MHPALTSLVKEINLSSLKQVSMDLNQEATNFLSFFIEFRYIYLSLVVRCVSWEKTPPNLQISTDCNEPYIPLLIYNHLSMTILDGGVALFPFSYVIGKGPNV